MKRLITYLPLLTICLIYFGFNNLYGYYHEFGIEIYNYIGSAEIVMSFLPTIVVLGSFFYSAAYQNLVFMSKNDSKFAQRPDVSSEMEQEVTPVRRSRFKEYFYAMLYNTLFWFIVINILLSILRFVVLRYYIDWELQFFDLIVAAIRIGLLIGILYINRDFDWFLKNSILFSLICIYFIGSSISNFRAADAKKVKAGYPIAQISFSRNGSTVRTGKNLLYIGQTQTQLFLYNRKDSSTTIYKQSDIDSLNFRY
ncbi:hypothetical protein [Pedobacter paludis]|uniref:Uncharacterized protein n=1 Tax=Pedobacter paludis TaxID=2203212 RepID=A0A317F5W0_9SPHI|nr:hypothetical protein [Pedobacter paludis]PWS33289.1 hypothetical protein DF947_01300 [Pedobacter paludis]